MTKPFTVREDWRYDWQDLRDVTTLEDLHRVSYGRLMHLLINGPYALDEELAMIRIEPEFGAPSNPIQALRAHLPGFCGPMEMLPARDVATEQTVSILAMGRLPAEAWFQLPDWTRPKILFGLDSAFTENHLHAIVEDLGAHLTEPLDHPRDWLGLMARQQYGVADIPGIREGVPAVPPVTGPSVEEWVLVGAGVFWPEEAHGWEPNLLEGRAVETTVGGHRIAGRYARLEKGRMVIQLQSDTPRFITTARSWEMDPDGLHSFAEAQLEALFRLSLFLAPDRYQLREDFIRLTTRVRAMAESQTLSIEDILTTRQAFFDTLPERLASRGAYSIPTLLIQPTLEIQAQVLHRMGFGPSTLWPGNVLWWLAQEEAK